MRKKGTKKVKLERSVDFVIEPRGLENHGVTGRVPVWKIPT